MSPANTRLLGIVLFFYFLWLLQGFSGALEFDRQQILSGDIWRIWTGHLVHTNNSHFALNIASAIILYFVFFTEIKPGELLLCSVAFASLISATLLCIYPDIAWYNGLSGLLHALVAYFCLRLAGEKDKVFWVGLAILWGKVLIETLRTHSGYEHRLGDMTVITESHLIGVIIGTATAIIFRIHFRGNRNTGEKQIEAQ